MSADPQWASPPQQAYWSADGQWWWDGYAWRPRAHHPAVFVPAGTKKSEFDLSVESIRGQSNRWIKAAAATIAWGASVEICISFLPARVHAGFWFAVVLTLVLEASFGVSALLALRGFGVRENWKKALHLGRPLPKDILLVPAWLLVSYFAAGTLLALILALFPDLRHQIHGNNPLAGSHSVPIIVYGYVLAVLVAPVAEEVVCRGLLLRAFAAKWGFLPGALLSSFIFGVAHAYEEPTFLSGLVLTIFIGTMGFMMCLLVRQTNRLSSSIAMHALMNTIALTIGFAT